MSWLLNLAGHGTDTHRYVVTVATGHTLYAESKNRVYVTLRGEHGESEKKLLYNFGEDLMWGKEKEYCVDSETHLGEIRFVVLEKRKILLEDNWFCRFVSVRTPTGEDFDFPVYRWFTKDGAMFLADGAAKTVCSDELKIYHSIREDELKEQQKIYRWKSDPGLPKYIDAEKEEDLPMDVRFDFEKASDFEKNLVAASVDVALKRLVISIGQSWNNLEDFQKLFWHVKTPITEFAMSHWKEDWFFGYQFLNGVNPCLIRRCDAIPNKFPVTNEMVSGFLETGDTLEQEVKKGNIFIADYEILDGITANVIEGEQQYLAAPICLLYRDPNDRLQPIAIQLNQVPGEKNPIFLPSDPEFVWLLAKIWVRSSDFHVHQINSHLLRTHLLGEVFSIATLRQLPHMHPLFKLLIPHTKYTLEINIRARAQLIGKNGTFDRAVASGGGGHLEIARRAFQQLTYKSLCFPDDLEERGLQGLKKHYYQEDGLKIWAATFRFVENIVGLYYRSDLEVKSDSELQAWVKDIYEEGFCYAPNSGMPTSLGTKAELCKFLTMIIFTVSAQHNAVNQGQFDWYGFVPNAPATMRKPPPASKEKVTMDDLMQSLPDLNKSTISMAITWHLSRKQPNMALLGEHQEKYFTEEKPQDMLRFFKEELQRIDAEIEERNGILVGLKYEYMQPRNIENSITI
ncbi:polyunsaturated fatty acid lipoxygenase ALOX12-like isoform X2 [Latimeria chalumnae]|uniref:polyunsaturated fatty acid lipoxygenase ALOX12-like isoform X2 n=1 Tax=Latimeria chalumnae TaxID=7897 RepID=UPI00313CC985